MLWYKFMALLEVSTVIIGQESAKTANVATEANNAVGAASVPATDVAMGAVGGFGSSTFIMVAVYAIILGALWFLMIRPQKKREKEIKEMQASIRAGDNIITSAGFFGKVVSVGEDCFVVEFGTNRGIRIPVRKSDVLGIKSPNIGAPIPPQE